MRIYRVQLISAKRMESASLADVVESNDGGTTKGAGPINLRGRTGHAMPGDATSIAQRDDVSLEHFPLRHN